MKRPRRPLCVTGLILSKSHQSLRLITHSPSGQWPLLSKGQTEFCVCTGQTPNGGQRSGSPMLFWAGIPCFIANFLLFNLPPRQT